MDKESKPKLTTPAKLTKWVKQFSPDEWVILCEQQDFLNIVMVDLHGAAGIAEDILKRDIGRDKL